MTERTEEVSTYVTPDVKRQIRMAAAEDDVGMSEWVRQLVLAELDERGNVSRRRPMTVTAD